ncbi:hypothetical protein IV500_12410 [Paeniglutamicibacter antarcticus]|uniref:Uncharacterized protein n=1 Tax=Arthrobacter terrae TaxID=2935737 RepID=A0A931CUN4_9MICC|nr:hypothetical protein [Arthrobacter terrae]MBG0740183.1 hypothetical protein [Arthrobacter terrae]
MTAALSGSYFQSGSTRDFDFVIGADGLHARVRKLAFGADQSFERFLAMVVAAFEVDQYPRPDELVAFMYAGVGF